MFYTNIYVMAPPKSTYGGGGVESLYQLVYAINYIFKKAYLFFETDDLDPVDIRYIDYNPQWVGKIDDNQSNLLIVPEIWTDRLDDYRHINKAIWWLSVDHNWQKFNDFGNKEITHFCQSYYVQHYLNSSGAYNTIMLNDYINLYHTKINKTKKDIIAYNPAKGIEKTHEVIKLNPSLKFVPIQNMTREETINLLSESKCYIDFGNHPGRDRIPREAALLGNCVITNLEGSAKFAGDIPIPSRYKIDDITKVGELLVDCLVNYETRINDFDKYRRIILRQKDELMSSVTINLI
jgi:hypothetical protein